MGRPDINNPDRLPVYLNFRQFRCILKGRDLSLFEEELHMIRTLPRGGAGRAYLAMSALAVSAMVAWYFQSPPPTPSLNGLTPMLGQGNLAGAQTKAQKPEPFYGKIGFAPNVVLVAFHAKVAAGDRLAVMNRHGLELDPDFRPNPYFTRLFIKNGRGLTPEQAVEQTVDALRREPSVRVAEPDMQLIPEQTLPNDTNFGTQWDLHNTGQSGGLVDADIDWPEAWAISAGTPVAVAVCDDGVQYTHPDLAANIWQNPGEIAGNGIDDDGNGYIDDTIGWDHATNDRDPMPTAGNTHGTHVAGTVGAVTNNGIGVAGVAPNVRIMCMRMYAGQASWMSSLIQAIDYSRTEGAKVISVSYNLNSYTQLLVEAIQRAGEDDVIYVNSAGNSTQNIDNVRGQITTLTDNALFVASTTRTDTLSSFSNFGQTSKLAAPGSDIMSTIPTNSYGLSSGTSMAAPHAAAAIAAVLAKFPNITAKQALARVVNTADILPSLTSIGGGRLNLNRALQPDSIAPSDPGKVRPTHYSSHALRVQFPAAGDDGAAGSASYYDVRVSTSPISLGNFNAATKVATKITPAPAGSFIETVVSGLSPNRTYYVGVRAMDEVGNPSAGIGVSPIPMTTRNLPMLDDVEGAAQFTPISGTWATTTSQSNSATRSWTDSPAGNYGNSQDTELRSNVGYFVNGPRILRFAAKTDLEPDHDFLYAEASADNGATWTTLGRLTGMSDWKSHGFSLAMFNGQTVRIRFRLTSDASLTRDGVYIDDVFLAPGHQLHLDTLETNSTYTAASPWNWNTVRSTSPTHSWTDSSAANYASNANSLLSGVSTVNIAGYCNPLVVVNAWSDLENAADNLRVMAALNGGALEEVGRITDRPQTWGHYSFPMTSGNTARLGFRFTTNPSTTFTGIWIDDVRIISEKWFGITDPRPGPND